jgi:hypothetical protein
MSFLYNWSFGTEELIQLVFVLATFTAICVSLYLARKPNTIRYKLIEYKIKPDLFKKIQFY